MWTNQLQITNQWNFFWDDLDMAEKKSEEKNWILFNIATKYCHMEFVKSESKYTQKKPG